MNFLFKIPTVLSVLMFMTTLSYANDSNRSNDLNNVESVILQAEKREFVDVFGPVQFADAFGNRNTGPHGTYGRFPGRFETPNHTHSHGYRAVVLEGKMTNPFSGQKNAPVMEPGSFWSVAANEEHTTACISAEPCIFLMWGDESFDFISQESQEN